MTNAEQDIKIAQTKQEVDDFKSIIENFIDEMRDRDNKRDADIKELRRQHEADMREMQKKQDAVANELRAEIRDALKNIQNLTIAAIVGIVAIAVAVIAFVFMAWQSADQKVNYQPPAQTQNFSQSQNNLTQ